MIVSDLLTAVSRNQPLKVDAHYFCNPSNPDGRVYVYVCIWLGLVLRLGLGLRLGFATTCSGHGHLCLTGCRNSAPKVDRPTTTLWLTKPVLTTHCPYKQHSCDVICTHQATRLWFLVVADPVAYLSSKYDNVGGAWLIGQPQLESYINQPINLYSYQATKAHSS